MPHLITTDERMYMVWYIPIYSTICHKIKNHHQVIWMTSVAVSVQRSCGKTLSPGVLLDAPWLKHQIKLRVRQSKPTHGHGTPRIEILLARPMLLNPIWTSSSMRSGKHLNLFVLFAGVFSVLWDVLGVCSICSGVWWTTCVISPPQDPTGSRASMENIPLFFFFFLNTLKSKAQEPPSPLVTEHLLFG